MLIIFRNSIKTTCVILFIWLINNFCDAQNIAPTLTATGNQPYCPNSQINIVTDFNVVDPDDTEIDAFYIQISTGYVLGEDTLTLLGSHPNIITSWSALEGKLTLSGVASLPVIYIDFIAAIKDIVFQSTGNNPIDKTFSITIGDANYLPSTDHYYEYVPALGITWTAALAAADVRTYFGLKGYLATITSVDEAQLSGEQAAGAGWLGATDEANEGTWRWVTGPEAGTVFWNGGTNGSTPNYANWNVNQPDNAHGGVGEDYLHVTDPTIGNRGAWNDLRVGGDGPGPYNPKGYIVEYGGTPGDPILQIAVSSNIYTTSIINTRPASVCGSGTVTLEATATGGADVLWFDVATGGIAIVNGTTFTTPNLTTTTTYYALASANGCEEGVREPVMATVYQLPVIQPSIGLRNCDEDGFPDGFVDFNLNEANEIVSNNSSLVLSYSYYMSISDANSGINEINSGIYNNSNGNTVYARVENSDGCYEVSQVNLEVSTTSFPQGYIQEFENCDDDSIIDGISQFDLTQMSSLFISEFPTGQNLSVHYYRNLNDATLENKEILNQSIYANEMPFSETLYVRVENDVDGSCFGIGPHLLLTVHPKPEFEISQSDILCANSGMPITLIVLNASDNFTYEWRDENGQLISNLENAIVTTGGTYNVTATSNYGCSENLSYQVNESSVADIDVDDISIVELSDYNVIKINNENNNLGIGDYEFSLYDISGPYQDAPLFEDVGAGSHMVFVRDKNGCGTVSIEVFILGFPKFFTPNNDGKNDTWQIKGLGTDFTYASKISLYDRYGKFIKQINAKTGYWDGTINGRPLAGSDYWFVAELEELSGTIKTYRGHFSLVR